MTSPSSSQSASCDALPSVKQSQHKSTTTAMEEQLLEQMLSQLSAQELEVAAKASYEYLVRPDATQTRLFAKQYALRLLRAKDGDATKALKRLKETLQFRVDLDVDGLCTAFTHEGNLDYAKKLEQEMQSKNVYVQGYDKEGRSTYIFIPRNVQNHDEEWTIKQHVYTLERAIAASKAEDKTVNAMVDFNGFSLRNAPPTHIGKAFMTTFRNHYAGAINSIYLIDAPTSFYCLWTIFKPLIGQKTRSKIHFVQSSAKNGLKKYYKPEEAASWMMSTGTKNRDLDTNEYLYETPFNCAFDE
ncbi:hypothetical protein ACA910_002937 [Epithemia clementina (nom. ined.)]